MSPKRRHTLSSFQLFLLLLVGIAIAAVAAVMFAPRKQPPPPVSKMSVEQRPAERVEPVEPPAPAVAPVVPVLPAVEKPAAPPASAPAALSSATAEPDAFVVRGKVTDSKSGQPLPGISVLALPEADPATLAACEEALAAAQASGNADAIAAAKQDCEAARLGGESIQGISNGAGDYLINLPEPGAYRIWVPSKDDFPQQRAAIASYQAALGTLDENRREVVHDVALELKSAIQGRVTEAGTSVGAPGLTVSLLDNAAANVLKTATTTDSGDYELPVDAPGDYAVRVELARSAYRQAQVVPFRRVKVTPADSLVRNINFEVDPAGVVWGYITTPRGEAVPGSEVVLTTAESPITQFVTAALRRTPPLSDRSEDDGYYELLGVPLGQEYQVFAQSATQSPQLSDPFVLTPSLRSLRVDVYLFPGSRISGTVVDPSGRRIPEARIRLIPSLTALASPLTSAVAFRDAQADANGNYVIEEVPAGSYGVYAQRRGYKFDTGGVPVYPDGYSEMTGVNITLYPIEAGVHDIFGVVRDIEGNGLSGVDVTISGLALDSMTRIEEKTSTSASGEFRISRVPSGRYGGVFVKEGYGAVRRTGLALDRENKITMTQSARVRGRVLVRESNAAPPVYTVQALQTASYGDARQSVMRSGTEQPSGTFSNPDGSFELYLAPGDYLLTATSEGLTPGRTPLSVEPGATLDDVTIYVSQQGASIRGIVRTMDRRSPQGAVARLLDTSGGLAAALAGGGPISTEYTVGEDGAFSFERLPAGSYVINVEHPTYARASSEVITLAEGESRDGVEITLGSGGVLTGTVCRSDGSPWPNAQVFVGSADSSTLRDATTDENGYFQIDGLATGEYTVTAASFTGLDVLGSERPARSVYVQDGQTATVDFCSPPIRVQGVCNPPPPSVLGGGQVILTPVGRPSIGQLYGGNEAELLRLVVGGGNSVDSQGFFDVGVDAPGVYQFEVIYFSLIPGGGGDGGAVEIVFSTLIELTGDQPVVQFDVNVESSG